MAPGRASSKLPSSASTPKNHTSNFSTSEPFRQRPRCLVYLVYIDIFITLFQYYPRTTNSSTMFPTAARLSRSVRLTLFTRVNCSLCDTAKHNVNQLQKRKPFPYSEIDVMATGNKMWKDVYEFDTPVLHVQRIDQEGDASQPKKLFHRFSEQEVETLVDEVGNSA